MMKRLLLLLLPLLLIALVVGCYGKTDIEEEGVFKCDTNDECVSGFECRPDPAKGSTVTQKFCMRLNPGPGANGGCLDADGDGYGAEGSDHTKCIACTVRREQDACRGDKVDCNDSDPFVYPGAPELCDGKDNNCNNKKDEAETKSCGTDRTDCFANKTIELNGKTYEVACENHVCVLKLEGNIVECQGGKYVSRP